MLQFVNIFFIPMVSVYILEGRGEEGLKLHPRLCLLYGSMTAVVAAGSHIVMAVIYRLFGVEISDATAEYTLLALIVAYAVPQLYRIIRFRIALSMEGK
nr:hypothetical protein [uncultured Acetatifactor sp.]